MQTLVKPSLICLLLCFICVSFPMWATDSFINVKDYGALGNGVHNDGPSILSAVNANLNATIRFPAGDYLINNSSGYLSLSGFTGTLNFDPHARLLCNTLSQGCFELSGGTGARIVNARIAYSSTPTTRTSLYAVHLYQTTDTIVDGIVVENSSSAAILADSCIRPMIGHANVLSSLADGIHFANCQDSKLSDSITNNTGDDGIAFLNYASGANNLGGQAVNVTVRNSKSRGITVIGQSDVTVSNFLVDTTSSAGIFCAYDATFSTRVPDKVKFFGGIIRNAGTLAPTGGDLYGVDFSGATSCEFDNISIYGSGTRSFSGSNSSGKVIASNIYANGGSNGFNIYTTAETILNNLTAEGSTSYGFFVNTGGTVMADNLRAINTATTDSLHRAIWFEGNNYFRAHALTVIDTQTTPTGYVLGEYNNLTGVGTGIQSQITNGTFSVQKNSTHILFSREDAP